MTLSVEQTSGMQQFNPNLVSGLWPFGDESLSRRVERSQASHYAVRAIKQIWALQHSTALPAHATASLIHALRATVAELSLPDSVRAWITLVDAQQCLFTGETTQTHQLLWGLMTQKGLTAEARVGAVCVAFHMAMLEISPWLRGRHAPSARTEALNEAMVRARQWHQDLAPLRHELHPTMQAQTLRLSSVMDALAGRELERSVWLRMASDMAQPLPSVGRAYSQLACAWIFMAEQRTARAKVAFEAALATSERLGWRLGAWLAAYELDVLNQPFDLHDTRLQRLPLQGLDEPAGKAPSEDLEGGRPPSSESRLLMAKQHIQANLGRRISIIEVARICQVSPRTLTQDFHVGEGKTPLEYINELKVHLAGEALAEGKKLREVATAVGFETVLGFIKAYVRVHGVPPPGHGSL